MDEESVPTAWYHSHLKDLRAASAHRGRCLSEHFRTKTALFNTVATYLRRDLLFERSDLLSTTQASKQHAYIHFNMPTHRPSARY